MKAKVNFISGQLSDSKDRPLLCFIPGGPGLSSATLRTMEIMTRSFDLAFIDPPGTGGLEEVSEPTFLTVVDAIEESLRDIRRPVVLCCHSFGALYGIELASRSLLRVEGLIALAAPISYGSYEVATAAYEKLMTPDLALAVSRWEREPTGQSLASMLSSYGRLYFSERTKDAGSMLLRDDKTSNETFIQVLPVLSDPRTGFDFVKLLSKISISKVIVAGEHDLMFPQASLRKDADATGCQFFTIQDAGHFVTFDQPEAVARLINKIFSSSAGV